jgi:uncharacterized membrane-anchored protein YhcB (DUF1043 family)
LLANRRRHDTNNPEQLEKLQSELDSYREEVSEHFVKTAHLVNELTHSYKAVYDHLERGAYKLVGSETLHQRLEKVEAEPVMLEYIGQRKAVEAHAPAEETPKARTGETPDEVEVHTEPEPAFVDVEPPVHDETEEPKREAKASALDASECETTNERASEPEPAPTEKRERELERVAG